ncbi:unnamed protein product [Caenorhabditis auriculariae]|uniref:Uncharacterized protein n=1 Tax=Caenorhabditis auriculariae TaxID=2777116 RepID=A0A8S1HBZ6_9PELO|nr:unnamed protein product [Caenorhabditis auriculariae]
MRNIWVVRHGERVDHVIKNWRNTPDCVRWDDPPLSERGLRQADEVGKFLASEPIEHVFTSPFTRCVQTTSSILANFHDAPNVRVEPGFGENLSSCADPPGRPPMKDILAIHSSVEEGYKPIYEVLPKEPRREDGCADRIDFVLREVLDKYPNGDILIVSHGSPIASVHLALIGSWNYVGLCTIGKIVQDGESFFCDYYNEKQHLTDKTNLRDHLNGKTKTGGSRRRLSPRFVTSHVLARDKMLGQRAQANIQSELWSSE